MDKDRNDKAIELFYEEQWADAGDLFKQAVLIDGEINLSYWYAELCILFQGNHTQVESSVNKHQKQLIDFLAAVAIEFANKYRKPQLSIKILKQSLKLESQNPDTLRLLSCYYLMCRNLSDSLKLAKKYGDLVTDIHNQVFANFLILTSLLGTGGDWQEIFQIANDHKRLMQDLVNICPTPLKLADCDRLFVTPFFLPYLDDQPQISRTLQNNFIRQCSIHSVELSDNQNRYPAREQSVSPKKLKIGYLSHCMRKHSVGWLSRWIFEHHNQEEYEIYAYFSVNTPELMDSVQERIAEKSYKYYKFGLNHLEIADQIYQDQIDILVDMDSITLDVTCQVMALKPAPIQVSWLGLDASGVPTIDYFIADPYVLPQDAQPYYSEKIWRLPNTYIAIEGFEVLFPTLTRDQLNIPKNAIIFISTQPGFKRHPDTVRLQVQILKGVPNSYLLIKGIADLGKIKESFDEIAEQEGVSSDRIKFLPMTQGEQEHRANLAIADVVLDTYPYNGATTTMETLWMCIPMVTRVGRQFAARNSYTMMMNAGITEGIAWTDEEYVEWGIKFGTDENLRKQVFWKLKESRKTSPLWNAKQFTKEMENAYKQMWNIYLDRK
jgi:predicted O-linked N-acetylglucosamine transferase (SPINDLY family)